MDRPRVALPRRHRVLAAAPLAYIAAFATGAAQAPIASATTICDPHGTHFYGDACMFAPSGSTFDGLFGDIYSSALSTPNNGSLVINDMWIVNPYSSPPHFIEAGIFSGQLCTHSTVVNGPCDPNSGSGFQNFEFFWADQRPNSDYYAHLEGQAASGTNYVDQIYTEGGGNWAVEIGPHNATSNNNGVLPSLIRTGTEEDPQKEAISCSKSSNLEYEDVNGVWHQGWSGNTDLGQNNPPFAQWNTDQTVLDYAYGSQTNPQTAYNDCFPSGAPAVNRTGSPGSSTDTNPTGSPSSSAETGPTLTDAQVSEIAGEFAAGMGDPNPTSIEHVESTRQQGVFALSGDTVSTNPDVYAIVMRGQFVANNAPRASEATAPSGPVLTLVINATTGALTDFGVQNQVPDLSSLGPVTVDR